MPRLIFTFAIVVISGCSQGFPEPAPPQRSSGVINESKPGEAAASADASAAGGQSAGPRKLTSEHLPNPVQVHAKVVSGGLPEGEEAFQELKDLGIRTIISVDGMTPDVETAAKYGLRYVHLPHGYDGIPEQRATELAKAVRDLDGPIYIHCHHGKHRSPAAASVACVSAGLIPVDQGLKILDLAGTSPNYRGLFESVQSAHPLDEALMDAMEIEFPQTAPIPPMAEAMVAIGHAYEHLELIEKSGWRTSPTHPDLVPAHEALMLREHFAEMLRTDEVSQQPERFRQLLKESEVATQKLEDSLREFASATETVAPPESLGELTALIGQNCKSCHQAYRDVPLSEK